MIKNILCSILLCGLQSGVLLGTECSEVCAYKKLYSINPIDLTNYQELAQIQQIYSAFFKELYAQVKFPNERVLNLEQRFKQDCDDLGNPDMQAHGFAIKKDGILKGFVIIRVTQNILMLKRIACTFDVLSYDFVLSLNTFVHEHFKESTKITSVCLKTSVYEQMLLKKFGFSPDYQEEFLVQTGFDPKEYTVFSLPLK